MSRATSVPRKDRVTTAVLAFACTHTFARLACAARSRVVEYGLDSSTGAPSRSKRQRSPAPRAAASASVFSQSRRRLPARDICSSAGDCRPRTKLRASARFADAVSCTVRSRSRAVAVSPSSSAFSAERPISTMLEKPWARVSCISRASRARSVSVPASCWLRASSPRVRRNSSAASRWFSASRYSARYASPVTTAKAAPNTGPSTIGSSRPRARGTPVVEPERHHNQHGAQRDDRQGHAVGAGRAAAGRRAGRPARRSPRWPR